MTTSSQTLDLGDTKVTATTAADGSSSGGFIEVTGRRRRRFDSYNVLWIELIGDQLTIVSATPATNSSSGSNKGRVTPDHFFLSVPEQTLEAAKAWAAHALDVAYVPGVVRRRKRIKVLVNPASGKGRAQAIFEREAAPLLEAARCQVDVEVTKQRGHGMHVARTMDVEGVDAVLCCSGDGLVHEVFNGLGKREGDARAALRGVAVAQLPCGSGNALSMNLNGTAVPSQAALAVVKGVRTALDLASVTQGQRRSLSFLSQSFGIVAEVDLGTDDMRWMGPARFTLGFLTRVVGKTIYPCELSIVTKPDVSSKAQIRDNHKARPPAPREEDRRDGDAYQKVSGDDDDNAGLPPLLYGTVNDPLPLERKLTPHPQLGNFFAGNMPWMTGDDKFFPYAYPSDGALDLIRVEGNIPLMTSIKIAESVKKGGTHFNTPEVDYSKVLCYRLVPTVRKAGLVSIDGESFPYEPFQVEVHRGLGTVLSKTGGRFEADGVPETAAANKRNSSVNSSTAAQKPVVMPSGAGMRVADL